MGCRPATLLIIVIEARIYSGFYFNKIMVPFNGLCRIANEAQVCKFLYSNLQGYILKNKGSGTK